MSKQLAHRKHKATTKQTQYASKTREHTHTERKHDKTTKRNHTKHKHETLQTRTITSKVYIYIYTHIYIHVWKVFPNMHICAMASQVLNTKRFGHYLFPKLCVNRNHSHKPLISTSMCELQGAESRHRPSNGTYSKQVLPNHL